MWVVAAGHRGADAPGEEREEGDAADADANGGRRREAEGQTRRDEAAGRRDAVARKDSAKAGSSSGEALKYGVLGTGHGDEVVGWAWM